LLTINLTLEQLRPNHTRANWAVILIYIVLGIEIATLITGYLNYDLLIRKDAGSNILPDFETTITTIIEIIALFYGIAYLISSITFIRWFRRAYFNLHLMVDDLNHTEGWAAGAWFVPFTNLVRPFQIMTELYNRTKIVLIDKSFSEKINL
jgi:sRNA-binding regulator protein Hfq